MRTYFFTLQTLLEKEEETNEWVKSEERVTDILTKEGVKDRKYGRM